MALGAYFSEKRHSLNASSKKGGGDSSSKADEVNVLLQHSEDKVRQLQLMPVTREGLTNTDWICRRLTQLKLSGLWKFFFQMFLVYIWKYPTLLIYFCSISDTIYSLGKGDQKNRSTCLFQGRETTRSKKGPPVRSYCKMHEFVHFFTNI